CGALVPPEEIRASRRIARCPSCDATIDLIESDGTLIPAGFRAPPPPDRLTIEIDEAPPPRTGSYREAIETRGGRFVASFRWFRPVTIFLTLFAVMWNGFLLMWYSIAFSTSAPVMMLVFPLIHVAVGVGIGLYALAGWFNRTRIGVENGAAFCKHGPIPTPFKRSAEVRLDDVDLFEVDRKLVRTNRSSVERWNVRARLRSGKRKVLASGLEDEEMARYLARKLERFLR
ncbi:MAG: hypothetical protein AAF411_06910, partial [Myxococcota bacterium]